MENAEVFSEEEQRQLAATTQLAGLALERIGEPSLIVIGFKKRLYVTGFGNKEQLAAQDGYFGFRVIFALVNGIDYLTKEELAHLIKMANAAIERREAARAESKEREEAAHG